MDLSKSITSLKFDSKIHQIPSNESQLPIYDDNSKTIPLGYYEKAHERMKKLSKERSQAESLQIDEKNRKLITYNDMEEQLGWLTAKWRRQALLKMFTVALITLVLSVTIGKNQKLLLFSFFMYSSFKFINQTYMHIRKIKVWLIISEFISTLLFSNQLFTIIISWVDPYNVLTSHSIYSDFSLLPAINCTVLYFFLIKISRELVVYPQFTILNSNISQYLKQLIENILNSFWNLKLLILRILAFLLVITFALNTFFFQINSKTLIFDILRPITILVNLVIILLLIIFDHVLLLAISKPIQISENKQRKILVASTRNKIPYILELLRMDPELHINIQRGLIDLAQEKSLEEMLLNKDEIGMIAKKYFTNKKCLKDFMELEVACSRFYNTNLDIFKEFVEYFLHKNIEKTMSAYNQIDQSIFSLSKINRASLTIDIFFPFKLFVQQSLKYFIILDFLRQARTLTYILDILIQLKQTSPSSDLALPTSLIDTKKSLIKIFQFVDQLLKKEPYLKNKNQAAALKDKLEMVIRCFNVKRGQQDEQ